MASVYCNRCNAKITAADSTCPSCGAPTSRVIPVVLGIAVFASCLFLYNVYRQSADNSPVQPASSTSNSPADKPDIERDPQSRIGLID